MNLGRMLARQLAGSGNMAIVGNVIGNVNPYIEWIKWLEYEPEFEKLRIKELISKEIENFSIDELEEIKKYKFQERILELFKRYGTKEISKDGYMEVYDYMSNNNIEDLMISKLTKEELMSAKEKIKCFSEIPYKELNEKVKLEKKNYHNLSMVDSYILHMIAKLNYRRGIAKLNMEIESHINTNEKMRQKSFHSCVKKKKNY